MNGTQGGFRLDPDADFGEIRAGNLGVRIARSAAELDAAQALRYRVFVEEMGARPGPAALAARRDRDMFDGVADHVLVIDHERGDGAEAVVGTSRLIRRAAAARIGRFYTEGEYDVRPLLAFPGNLLELGRFCIAHEFRSGGTIQLLWRGMGAYIYKNRIDLLFGCASLPGTDLDALTPQLSYLWHRHLAPEPLRARALPELRVPMDRMDMARLDERAVANELPPLLKSYLRLGGVIGDGAVLDRDFNTTDVCIIVPTHSASAKYYDRFYKKAARDAGIEVD